MKSACEAKTADKKCECKVKYLLQLGSSTGCGAPEVGSRSPRSRRPANSAALKKLIAELSMYVGPKAYMPCDPPAFIR